MEAKEQIRAVFIKKRNNICEEEWNEMSSALVSKVSDHPLFQKAETVYGYVSYKREADTWPLLALALEAGKKVAVPKVEGKEMEFYYIRSLDELKPGFRGIFEPEKAHMADDDAALILMPLVAFDKNRNRIGQGGGYYDRYLKRHPDNPTMGIAFSIQETDMIPAKNYDKKPDVIVTEEKEV